MYFIHARVLDSMDKKGSTPLHIAVKNNDPVFAQALLDNGAGMYVYT